MGPIRNPNHVPDRLVVCTGAVSNEINLKGKIEPVSYL